MKVDTNNGVAIFMTAELLFQLIFVFNN